MADIFNIAGRIHSTSQEEVALTANEVLDTTQDKKQSAVNSAVQADLNGVHDDLDGANGIKGRVATLESQVAFDGDFQAENTAEGITTGSGKIVTANAARGAIDVRTGYFVCGTEAATAAKAVTAGGFVLTGGGAIKIKMKYANTAASGVTLNINSTDAKTIYYNGEAVNASNTWEAGEVVEVYYDPSANSNAGAYYANNVAGGAGDGVFDLTAKTGDTYLTLGAALTAANTAIPANKKKGGMSIKYVQTSDNNSTQYVQYRYMGTATTGTPNPFLDEANWQGVDDEPTAGSHNLVESGGVKNSIGNVQQEWIPNYRIVLSGGIGTTVPEKMQATGYGCCDVLCNGGSKINISSLTAGSSAFSWGFVDDNDKILSWSGEADETVSWSDDYGIVLIAPEDSARFILNGYLVLNKPAPILSLSDSAEAHIAQTRVDIENDIKDVEDYIGRQVIEFKAGKIDLSGGPGTVIPNPATATGMYYCKAACTEGSVVNVTGYGTTVGLWGFIDENGTIISWSGINIKGSFRLTAPSGTAFVVANSYNPSKVGYLDISLSDSAYKDIYAIEDKLKGVEYSYKDKVVNIEWVIGKYIYTSGAIANNVNYKYGVFAANMGDLIVVNVDVSSIGCIIGIKHSLEASDFVPVVKASGQTQYSYVCETNCYIGISGINNTNFNYRVISSRIDGNLQGCGTLYATKRLNSPAVAENSKYRTSGGSIASLGGYAYTVPIFLKKGTFISNDIGVTSNNCSVISEVSENNEFLRSLYIGDGVAGVKEYVIDKTGYYSFSCRNEKIDYFVIVEFANGELFFNNPLDKLFLNMESQTVPPREILRSPSFVGIVHTWGFIGDSLSSGEQAVYEDGTTNLIRPDKYDYSWGQRMCALNSVEGYNFSAGGQTTKGWCQGTVRAWGEAQLEANWKQAYCIALGVNDRSAPYPKGDASTDIDLNDYNNNADTFAGWYAGIIQRLRSVNPKCRIFCITIPYNNQQGYLDNNEIIRAIVPKFSKCYLVDLANYHWTPNGLALNDHLSPAGYQWAAWEINTYIDWIIRNNISDFRDIAFVGTNYSADIQ